MPYSPQELTAQAVQNLIDTALARPYTMDTDDRPLLVSVGGQTKRVILTNDMFVQTYDWPVPTASVITVNEVHGLYTEYDVYDENGNIIEHFMGRTSAGTYTDGTVLHVTATVSPDGYDNGTSSYAEVVWNNGVATAQANFSLNAILPTFSKPIISAIDGHPLFVRVDWTETVPGSGQNTPGYTQYSVWWSPPDFDYDHGFANITETYGWAQLPQHYDSGTDTWIIDGGFPDGIKIRARDSYGSYGEWSEVSDSYL